MELKKNLESLLHEKERQLEVEMKSRKEASNSNQQVNEKIYSMEKVVSREKGGLLNVSIVGIIKLKSCRNPHREHC